MQRHREYTPLIGVSARIAELRAEIENIALSDAKVLITGESGSGKEVVARQIHAHSTRAAKPFVAINCAGIPENLLESELFGHVKGSFTGAFRDKSGRLEMAAGGTMFLDEIGEMSLRMQGSLLRFLETGEIEKVGAERVHACRQRARGVGDQSQAPRSHRRRAVPRGSLLSPRCDQCRRAAAS